MWLFYMIASYCLLPFLFYFVLPSCSRKNKKTAKNQQSKNLQPKNLQHQQKKSSSEDNTPQTDSWKKCLIDDSVAVKTDKISERDVIMPDDPIPKKTRATPTPAKFEPPKKLEKSAPMPSKSLKEVTAKTQDESVKVVKRPAQIFEDSEPSPDSKERETYQPKIEAPTKGNQGNRRQQAKNTKKSKEKPAKPSGEGGQYEELGEEDEAKKSKEKASAEGGQYEALGDEDGANKATGQKMSKEGKKKKPEAHYDNLIDEEYIQTQETQSSEEEDGTKPQRNRTTEHKL